MRCAALALATLALVACGEGGPATNEGSQLDVVVRPEGPGGPTRTKTVSCPGSKGCDVPLKPTPPDVACTEIYGGPATATVIETVDGTVTRRARFSRINGCEIARWDEAEALLGAAP